VVPVLLEEPVPTSPGHARGPFRARVQIDRIVPVAETRPLPPFAMIVLKGPRRRRLMERRQQARSRTLKSAHILLNHHHSVIDCTVRNLSPTGACLTVASTLGIPEIFDLMFDADKSIRTCRLIWHKEKQIGVEFEPTDATLTKSA
jgi:hypothetical protein